MSTFLNSLLVLLGGLLFFLYSAGNEPVREASSEFMEAGRGWHWESELHFHELVSIVVIGLILSELSYPVYQAYIKANAS